MAANVFVHHWDSAKHEWVNVERCLSRVPAVGEIVYPGNDDDEAGELGPHKVVQVDWFLWRADTPKEFRPDVPPSDAEVWLEPVDPSTLPRNKLGPFADKT